MVAVAGNPLLRIWLHPRETIRFIVTESPTRFVVLFACILGVNRVLGRASVHDLGEDFSFGQIMLATAVLGPVNGFFLVWVFGWAIEWTGRWMGGSGSAKEIRAAIVWGLFPVIVATFLWIPILLIAGSEIFNKEIPDPGGGIVRPPGVKLLAMVQFVLGVWGLTTVCQTLAEVQGYASAWRAVGNYLLAALAIMLPVVGVGLILWSITH